MMADKSLLVNVLGKGEKKSTVRIDGRTAAAAILTTMARHETGGFKFCLSFFYDYDAEFLNAVAEKLGLLHMGCGQFLSRLRSVVRKLEDAGVIYGTLKSCHKEYIGEPVVLKSYGFPDHGYAMRLAPDLWPNYKPMGRAEVELEMFLDRAYPKKETR